MPPKFMTVNEAAQQLLEIVKNKKQKGEPSLLGRMIKYYKLLFNIIFIYSRRISFVCWTGQSWLREPTNCCLRFTRNDRG